MKRRPTTHRNLGVEFGLVQNGYSMAMELAFWAVDPSMPVFATAIHNGHDVRPEVGAELAVDAETRLREEDPWTSDIAAAIGSHVSVARSRFEVDLNRPRPRSVYLEPEDAWGIEIWKKGSPDDSIIEHSRELHDSFYRRLADVLEDLGNQHGGFVLYDVHSYNHRRQGPASDPEPGSLNPTVNLGTKSVPPRWIPVADRFLASISRSRFKGGPIDARANVRFEGGYLSSWVNERYAQVGCALAVEFKKEFMDEWTNDLDPEALDEIATALAKTTHDVWEAHQQCR